MRGRIMCNSYQLLIKVLNDSFGIIIFDEHQDDFAIDEYIFDSVEFIQFIVSIEEEIGHDLPDDFLNMEILCSARGFAAKLDSYMELLSRREEVDES